jgi:hypothetical protein
VSIYCFGYTNHTGVRLNRRSQIEILIFMNSDPRIWYSKQHEIVESGYVWQQVYGNEDGKGTDRSATKKAQRVCGDEENDELSLKHDEES